MPTRVFRNVVKDPSTESRQGSFGFAGMAGLLLGHGESRGLSILSKVHHGPLRDK